MMKPIADIYTFSELITNGYGTLVIAGNGATSNFTGAEFERIDIIDGKALLGVSVSTNSEVKASGEGEGWGKANIERVQVEDDGTMTLSVPMPVDKGFMILKSKGASK